MPVLPTAPRSQPWMTNGITGETTAESRGFVTVSPPRFALRTSPTLSLAAEAEAETSPSSSTIQRPSNEVIGGAFIGAFLGVLLLIVLLKWCCGGSRKSSEDGSTDSSSTSPKDPPPLPQPVYQVPPGPINPTGGYAVPGGPNAPLVYEYRASRTAERSRAISQPPKTRTTIAEVDGKPAFVVRRVPQPRRPRRHSVAGLESVSSSSERSRRRSSRRTEGVQIIDLDVPRNFRAPAFGEVLREVKP